MNRFISILIFQNILVLFLISFIPTYMIYKKTHDVYELGFLVLFLFIAIMLIIIFLDSILISDSTLSFGFLRFYPFIFLFIKLNSILNNKYLSYRLTTDQKCILLIHVMNNHAILSDESYFKFSKFMMNNKSPNYEEYRLFTETPFWVEVYPDIDQYSVNKNLLASHGLTYNEKKFAFSTFGFFAIYLLLIAYIILF